MKELPFWNIRFRAKSYSFRGNEYDFSVSGASSLFPGGSERRFIRFGEGEVLAHEAGHAGDSLLVKGFGGIVDEMEAGEAPEGEGTQVDGALEVVDCLGVGGFFQEADEIGAIVVKLGELGVEVEEGIGDGGGDEGALEAVEAVSAGVEVAGLTAANLGIGHGRLLSEANEGGL